MYRSDPLVKSVGEPEQTYCHPRFDHVTVGVGRGEFSADDPARGRASGLFPTIAQRGHPPRFGVSGGGGAVVWARPEAPPFKPRPGPARLGTARHFNPP